MKAPAARPRRRRRAVVAIAAAALLLAVLLDQLGCRRLSGRDLPEADPMSPALRAHVEKLAAPAWGGRVPGTAGNADAARYLAGELERLGVGPLPSAGGYLVPLAAADLGHNVIGYLPAEGGAREGAIVLGAHFDHLGQVKEGLVLGADDNASSVAVLLGALPAIAARPRKHPVIVAFFNTEEAPYFGSPRQGSRSFAASPPPEIGRLASIRLAVVLDLIGGVVWKTSADTVFACGAEKAPGLGAIVDGVREPGLDVRRLGIHLVEDLPGHQRMPVSDYDIFRLRGVPFLFLSTGRTPRYHRPADLPDTLYYDRMARTARWIAGLVAAVDGAPEPLRFDAKGLDVARDRETLAWAIGAAASPLRWVPGTGPITAARLIGDRGRIEAMGAPGHVMTPEDATSLARASFRLQCLIYGYPICFTL